jgi:hypothetical protein
MSDNSVSQRIASMVDYFHKGNKSAFSKTVGISNQSLGEIVGTRQSAPSFAALQKILSAFPQVRAEWLVLGHGEMLDDASLMNKVNVASYMKKRQIPAGATRGDLELLRSQAREEYAIAMHNADAISDFLNDIRQRLAHLDL